MNTEEKLSIAKVSDLKQTTEAEKLAASPTEGEALRKRRIDDFQRDALADPDALQANLGMINGGLMRMSFRMETAIEEAMMTVTDPVDRFERLGPAISAFLQLTRQIDRFSSPPRILHGNRGGLFYCAILSCGEDSAI